MSWFGWIPTTFDALQVIEGGRRGVIPRVTRRLVDTEHNKICSGSVFVFDEEESGIDKWRDKYLWSPHRRDENFYICQEVSVRPRPKGNDENGEESHIDNAPQLKVDGLIKKTFTVTINDRRLHLISYYRQADTNGRLQVPTMKPKPFSFDVDEYSRCAFRIPPKLELGSDGVVRYRWERYEEERSGTGLLDDTSNARVAHSSSGPTAISSAPSHTDTTSSTATFHFSSTDSTEDHDDDDDDVETLRNKLRHARGEKRALSAQCVELSSTIAALTNDLERALSYNESVASSIAGLKGQFVGKKDEKKRQTELDNAQFRLDLKSNKVNFTGTLSSQNVQRLRDIAWCLGIAQTGKIKEVSERVRAHFTDNPHLKSEARYEALFPPRGASLGHKRRRVDKSPGMSRASSPSAESSPQRRKLLPSPAQELADVTNMDVF
ncbi:hypothetical protein BDZ89DRAFT_1059071 [Hymenopellis radicata]|nr:hypothetical protein BDZ89DRAFT_1059071 [Hymenopellis radicata]